MNSGEILLEDLVFIDEAGAKLGMSNDYARAEGGDRVVVNEPKNKGKNISLVGAIGLSGVVAMMYCLCTMNAMGFMTFVTEYLAPNLRPGQIVIMDNINFHTSESVKSAIEAVGAYVVFLPPYSPDLNPIENLWSKLKMYLRKMMPKSLEEFHTSLQAALETITDYDYRAWYENSGYIQY